MVKGRALARPSERSERLEAVVRPGLPDTIAAATQKEKADAAKAEAALENADGSTEADLEEASEIAEELNEQEVLDDVIAEEAQETAADSTDLSSEEVQTLNEVAGELEASTADVKGKAKKELLETAGKLVAKGKSVKDLKSVKDKTVERKELRAKGAAKKVEKAAAKDTSKGSAKAVTKTVEKKGGAPKATGKSTDGNAGGKGKNK